MVPLPDFSVLCCVQVEFEWLRQYWFQGQRYTRFCSWWARPMEQLENDWREMELMVRLHRDPLGPSNTHTSV